METNILNIKQYSGETFQKIGFHNALINPLHPLKDVRGFFISNQNPTLTIHKNHQEGLNLVHPLEPNLLGINETSEGVSIRKDSKKL